MQCATCVQCNFLAWTNLLISLYVVSMAGSSVSVELEHFLLVLWQFFPSWPSRAARIYLKNRNISTLSDVGFRNSFNSLEINHEQNNPIIKKNWSGEKVNFKIKQLPEEKKENRIGRHTTYAKYCIWHTKRESLTMEPDTMMVFMITIFWYKYYYYWRYSSWIIHKMSLDKISDASHFGKLSLFLRFFHLFVKFDYQRNEYIHIFIRLLRDLHTNDDNIFKNYIPLCCGKLNWRI